MLDPRSHVVLIGKGAVSTAALVPLLETSLVVLPERQLDILTLPDDAQVLVVADDCCLLRDDAQVMSRLKSLAERPNTHVALSLAWVVGEELRSAIAGMAELTLFGAEDGEAADEALGYDDPAFLVSLILSASVPGGQVYLHDFGHELAALRRRDEALPTAIVDVVRRRGIYLCSNLEGKDRAVRSIYVDDAPAAFLRQPDVSVIVPVFDAVDYLPTTLESLLNQDHEDFEVVLVDDGSSDGTTELVEAIRQTDARFRGVFQQNQGVGAARNRGLEMARGRHVAFLDHDDILPSDSLSRRLAFLARGEFAVCGGRCTIIDERGDSILMAVGRTTPAYFRDTWQVAFHISSLMGRSDVMKRHRFWKGRGYPEDWLYLNEILREGWAIGSCEGDPVSAYRWHSGSRTGGSMDRHFFTCLRLMDDLITRPGTDLGIDRKPEDAMDLPDARVSRAKVARIQSQFFSLALRDAEERTRQEILGLMNGISVDFAQTIEFSTFEGAAARVFVQSPKSGQLRESILRRWPAIVEQCEALAVTEANARYVSSLVAYLEHLRRELDSKTVPSPWRMRRRLKRLARRFRAAGSR